MSNEEELSAEEARRMVGWLRKELERQREINGELRRAVADMARAFQETLARANDAAESGDIERVKRITFENRKAWQGYLQQIVAAAARLKGRQGDEETG
jgi:molecular chaperone DnaK (HSP70)